MYEIKDNKCMYNDTIICNNEGSCKDCTYSKKLYLNSLYGAFQSNGNEQLSFIDGVKYEKTKRRKK